MGERLSIINKNSSNTMQATLFPRTKISEISDYVKNSKAIKMLGSGGGKK